MFRQKLPSWTRNPKEARELERKLPLLGPRLSDQSPESFSAYVRGLYKEPPRGKTTEPKPKGRTEVTPTKKRKGVYKVTFLDQKLTFEFTKRKRLKTQDVMNWAKKLACAEDEFRNFLLKKNFSLDDVDVDA